MKDVWFRALFEGSRFGIAITGIDGRFLEANPAYRAIVGYSLDELRHMTFQSLTHPDDLDGNDRQITSLVSGAIDAFEIEKRYLSRSGEEVWVSGNVSLIRNAAGEPTNIVGTFSDVTDARRVSEELRRSEDLRRIASEVALVGGWAMDVDRSMYWSDELFTILDAAERVPLTLKMVGKMYPPGDRERADLAVRRAFLHAEAFDLELEIDSFAGRRIPVRSIGHPVVDESGRVVRLIGAVQDISDLRRLIGEAEESAQRLASTLESMTDALYTLDHDWKFTYVNKRAAELLQRRPEELVGRELWTEFPAAADSLAWEAFHEARSQGKTREFEGFYYAPLDTWFHSVVCPSDEGLAVYFRDVTTNRQAQEDIKAREADLAWQAALLDETTDAIVVRDLDGRAKFWNSAAERIYGWSAAEAVGSDVVSLVHADPAEFEAANAILWEQGAWAGDLVVRRRDGERLVIAARWTLVRDDEGEPDAILAINTDVSDQRRIDTNRVRSQRLEGLGTLAGGIAHDLNNMLSPIVLASEMLQDTEVDPERADLVSIILDSARRGAELVAQVLWFARGSEGSRSLLSVEELVRRVHGIIRETFPKNIEVRLEVEPDTDLVVADETQIQQVLMNLVVNGRDAMPEGGALAISLSMADVDAQFLAAMEGVEPGRYVVIEVEDAGHGMAPEVLDRVFEPFFTTKEQGSGTGLGLSTSAGIVKAHGGLLRGYSELGRGSRFRLYLPAVAGTVPSSQRDVAVASATRGVGQFILVVDDEQAVREMTRRTLEAAGYRVIEAGNGAEAVAEFVRSGATVDLVLMDMMMPVMDGPSAIQALRTLSPDLRFVAASGLHDHVKTNQALDAEVEHFLPKPYTSYGLLQIVASALDVD